MRARVAATIILLLSGAAQAASLKVYPVRIVLSPKEPVQTMTIENSNSEAARIQLRVFAWRQVNGKDVFEETRDVLANPGLFEIAAKGQQIARFGLRTVPGQVEKSYRVVLEEVPGLRPTEPGEVRTLLRISIPIFVPALNPNGRLTWRAWPTGPRTMTFEIGNQGSAHVQINRLAISGLGATKLGAKDMSVYLLPGASQRIVLDLNASVPAAVPLKLNAVTDQGNLAVDLVVEPAPRENSRP